MLNYFIDDRHMKWINNGSTYMIFIQDFFCRCNSICERFFPFFVFEVSPSVFCIKINRFLSQPDRHNSYSIMNAPISKPIHPLARIVFHSNNHRSDPGHSKYTCSSTVRIHGTRLRRGRSSLQRCYPREPTRPSDGTQFLPRDGLCPRLSRPHGRAWLGSPGHQPQHLLDVHEDTALQLEPR